jgi:hypothetical protein
VSAEPARVKTERDIQVIEVNRPDRARRRSKSDPTDTESVLPAPS